MNTKTLNTIGLKSFLHSSNRKSVTINKPVEISRYSYDSNNNDYKIGLNKFKKPNIGSDLLQGYNGVSSMSSDSDTPLQFILNKLMKSNFNVTNSNFISYRNSFRKIFESYKDYNAWSISVQTIGSTIHLGMNNTPMDYSTANDIHLKSMYSGNKFEEISKVQNDEIVYKYCSIIHSKLFNNNFTLACEIDCFEKSNGDNNNNNNEDQEFSIDDYVELKTNREISNKKSEFTFRSNKLFKIWFQSYIAGVSKIYMGIRDDNFKLKDIIFYNTHDIPKQGVNWDQSTCLMYGNEILEFIKNNTNPNKSYSLQFKDQILSLIETPSINLVNDEYKNYFNNCLIKNQTIGSNNGEKRNLDKLNENNNNNIATTEKEVEIKKKQEEKDVKEKEEEKEEDNEERSSKKLKTDD